MSLTICLLCGEMGVDAEHVKKCNAPSDLAAARAAIVELRAAHASALARAEAAEKERDEARAERDEARRDFDAVVDERNAMTSAAASLRERVRALAEAAGVLADNVINLRGHYDANPHLASTSVRQGLAALADLAAALRALLAPTKEEP